MKKALTAILVIATVISAVGTLAVSADFGSGVEVMTSEGELIKTGLFGKKIVFSDTDIKQGLAISDFDSITVTKLPKSTEGTLMLAGRRVGEGSVIRRKNIGALVFIPASKDVKESSFSFTVKPYADNNDITFKLRFTDKINYEPKIEDASPTSLMTQRDIASYGKMKATDAEGDKISFIVVSYPEYGTLELLDKASGEFRYTPTKEYVGEDSFSYVARDEWGNFSTLATMTVSVAERKSEVVYQDMKGEKEYNAAVTLSAMGIMSGKIIGDGTYFLPEEEVTKAEFVAMLMKTLGIKADSTLTASYFDDNDKIPPALVSYVATAQKAGYITGSFEKGKLVFKPDEPITSYEAAGIMKNVLGKSATVESDALSDSAIPVWAREDVYLMCSLGIFDTEFENIEKDDVITKRECAAYLFRILSM